MQNGSLQVQSTASLQILGAGLGGGKAGCVEDAKAFGLRFVPRSGAIPGHWWIYHADGSSRANNACYNVLVIRP